MKISVVEAKNKKTGVSGVGKISVFSFFSGAGFLDLGFEKSSFNVCFVNEIKDSFLYSYKFSREKMGIKKPRYGYSNESIESFLNGEKFNFLTQCIKKEKDKKNVVGFIGGPPCPDFSVGGKNKGKHGDNGRLSGIYVELICKAKPDFFVFENVKGLIRTKRHLEFLEELKTVLEINGYSIRIQLINSIEYGVPQDRDRVIMFGVNKKYNIELLNWEKNKKFKRDILNIKKDKNLSDKNVNDIPIELTVGHWFEKNHVLKHPNAGDRFNARTGLKKFLTLKEGDDKKKSYKRLHRKRFSPTACYGNNEVHIHPTEPRRISVAEALSIQSLPEEFTLPPDISLTDKFKMVGNGVPFLLAKGIAKMIREFFDSKEIL